MNDLVLINRNLTHHNSQIHIKIVYHIKNNTNKVQNYTNSHKNKYNNDNNNNNDSE